MCYKQKSKAELKELYSSLKAQYEEYKASGLKLDLSRGKPCAEQLDFASELLVSKAEPEYYIAENGFDCRNYGVLEGIPEIRRIFSEVYGVSEKNMLVCGNSSLSLIYDAITRLMVLGTHGCLPWKLQGRIKFICPAPGYDRHFGMLDTLGFELIYVPMREDGPDMDMVEKIAAEDDLVKGLICVPKYSNPTGVTFSEKVIERLVSMKAAPDFRIIWDNAYAIHDFDGEGDTLPDIFGIAKKYGNEDRVLYFTSTSKISFPGAGVSMVAASDRNIGEIKQIMGMQTIGNDKLNQLRHARFMKNAENTKAIMKKHSSVIKPKFKMCSEILHKELDGTGTASWYDPHGGYFISLNTMEGCAKRVWTLMKECGVSLTNVGATYPYGKDPHDSNLRLAPTYCTEKDLEKILYVLSCCIKLAACEKLLAE